MSSETGAVPQDIAEHGRPLRTTNLRYLSTEMFDERETLMPLNNARTMQNNLNFDLSDQATSIVAKVRFFEGWLREYLTSTKRARCIQSAPDTDHYGLRSTETRIGEPLCNVLQPESIPWRRHQELIDAVNPHRRGAPYEATQNCGFVSFVIRPVDRNVSFEPERSDPVEKTERDLCRWMKQHSNHEAVEHAGKAEDERCRHLKLFYSGWRDDREDSNG